MKKSLLVMLLTISPLVFISTHADSKAAGKSQQLVDDATSSALKFANDTNMSYLHANLGNAEGVLIIPKLTKGAFIVGGSGGSGVLLKRQDSNGWSYPAFYTMSSGSIGLQFGGEVSEIILMIMTKGGMDSLLASSFKLGTDASVAAGPVGVGAKAQSVDILAYSRTQGVFAGVSLEGSAIKVRPDYNSAYYGKDVRTSDVFIVNAVTNPHADKLRAAVAALVQVGASQ